MALLVCPRNDSGIDSADEESIDEAAKLKQVFGRPHQRRPLARDRERLKVGPLGRQERLASVRQNQHEVQAALTVRVAEDSQRLAYKGVMGASDGNPLREVLTVGSVWRCPSTEFAMTN
jgi:hypothetical protein